MGRVLRIGIDGYNLALRQGTGVATYGRVLAATLHGAGNALTGVYGIDAGRDPTLREINFFDRLGNPEEPSPAERRQAARRRLRRALQPWLGVAAGEVPLSDRVERAPLGERVPAFDRIVTAPDLFSLALRHFGLYRRFVEVRVPNPPDIMHWTYPVPLTMRGARNVYTLHDLVPLRLPFTTLDRKSHYRALLASCIARADAICTVSEASRTDILREFTVDPSAVTNTYQASPLPATVATPEEDAAAIAGIFDLLPRDYFLFLGAIEPKKNVSRLIEAYLALPTTTPLVIVGSRGWQSTQELALLTGDHSVAAGGRIRMISHLHRPLLIRLIRTAKAILFPSLSEGFGLPVLEAMQLGTPVLTSDSGALREVAGDAALLVDPYDIAAIRSGIARLDEESGLRDRLAEAGLARAGLFSQPAYLARLERLYCSILTEGATKPPRTAASHAART